MFLTELKFTMISEDCSQYKGLPVAGVDNLAQNLACFWQITPD